MKLTPDSPEITAYALGEVNAEEHALIEHAIAESPELRAEIASLRRLADTLETDLSHEPSLELDPVRRDTILEAAADPSKAQPMAAAGGSGGGPLHFFSQLWTGITRPVLGFSLAAATALSIALALWTPWKVEKAPKETDSPENTLRSVPDSSSTLSTKNQTGAPTPAVPGRRELDRLARVPEVPRPVAAPTEGNSLERGGLGGLAPSGSTVAESKVAPAPSKGLFSGLADKPGASPSRNGPVSDSFGAAPRSRLDLTAKKPGMEDGLASGDRARVKASAEPGRFGENLGLSRSKPADPSGSKPASGSFAVFGKPELKEVDAELPALANRYGSLPPPGRPPGSESYARIAENPYKDVATAPLSTFGMDTDTASYANARRFLREGSLPPRDAVRLEELVNYFPYDYAAPRGNEPFAAHAEVADCPWNPEHRLVRIGIQAREGDRRERPRANLVFLVDVSGSMQPDNKLPLVQRSLRLLLDQLEPTDSVGVVTYAGEAKVALEPTRVSEKPAIQKAIDALQAASGTDGGSGIQRAYAMATNRFIAGGINRVILCTDGDFNVGLTRREELLDLITEKAKSGVFLSVLGYGMDNYKDDTAELLADRGNGNYSYVDSFTEARKVLKQEVQGTLQTVAKDAKVQVEFNPARVASWRLLGYENRLLADRDFNDDKKDAGEVGAGHAVTALYEIVPVAGRRPGVDPLRYANPTAARAAGEHGDELLNLKVRYKDPEGDTSRLMQRTVKDSDRDAAAATADFKFAAAVVGYGLMLRDSPAKGDLNWDKVLTLAEEGLGPDREGYRAEFIDLVRRAKQLSR